MVMAISRQMNIGVVLREDEPLVQVLQAIVPCLPNDALRRFHSLGNHELAELSVIINSRRVSYEREKDARDSVREMISLTGLGALSAWGDTVVAHRDGILHAAYVAGAALPFRPLGELLDCDYPKLPAAWIPNRAMLTHRKWSPAAMAALYVARQAVLEAGWSQSELRETVLMLGTSRGGAAGWIEPWPGRRGFPLMAASNAMHGEAAAAVSIELGIGGAYQVISTGCSAGLDALGMARMHLQCGMAQRALVVAVDLPLVKFLLDSYHATGILSKTGKNDPYHPLTSGIFPAEAAAAVALEIGSDDDAVKFSGYLANSDACDPLSLAPKSGQLQALLRDGIRRFGMPQGLCPHATGTPSHAAAEPQCFAEVFSENPPSLHLLKPFLGHGIGAGSLLETVLWIDALRRRETLPNLPGLHAPVGFELPHEIRAVTGPIFKIAASLGGHNALVALETGN